MRASVETELLDLSDDTAKAHYIGAVTQLWHQAMLQNTNTAPFDICNSSTIVNNNIIFIIAEEPAKFFEGSSISV
jgi:hypothetical protein